MFFTVYRCFNSVLGYGHNMVVNMKYDTNGNVRFDSIEKMLNRIILNNWMKYYELYVWDQIQ